MNNTKALEVKEDPIKREFRVEDDGTVIMHEVESREAKFTARDFLSFFREHEATVEKINNMLSDEYRNNLLKQKEEVVAGINKMRPFMEESDKIATEINRKKDQEQRLGFIKQILEQGKIYPPLVVAYEELDDDFKSQLTKEEVSKINQFKVEMERKKQQSARKKK